MSISMHLKSFVHVTFDINGPVNPKAAYYNLLMAVFNENTGIDTLYSGVRIDSLDWWS